MKILSLTVQAHSRTVAVRTAEATATPISLTFDEIGSFVSMDGLTARCEELLDEKAATAIESRAAVLADLQAKQAEAARVQSGIARAQAELQQKQERVAQLDTQIAKAEAEASAVAVPRRT